MLNETNIQQPTVYFFNVEGILMELVLEDQLFKVVKCLFMNGLLKNRKAFRGTVTMKKIHPKCITL